MRYRLIAIDLDGTLLDRRGRVSQTNLDAIAQAQAAGVLVVPCTGRGWRESGAVLAQLPTRGPGVFVSGAMVCDTATGQSIDLAVIEPNLVLALVDFLRHMPEAVLICREPQRCGHDYLVTGDGALTANTQWWFEATGSTVYFKRAVAVEDLHHTLRVGVVAEGGRPLAVAKRVQEAFGDRVFVHCFQAVQTPNPDQEVHVLEVFANGVDKWRGLGRIIQERGILPSQVAAIGDEVNDVAMLRSAGCGVAMANAAESARAVADRVTRSCEEDGVAHAIGQLLAGVWDG